MQKAFKPLMCALAMTLAAAGAAMAEDAAAAPPALDLPLLTKPSPAMESDDVLAGLSGGANTAIALTEQDLTAVNTGNQINASTVGSGSISLDGSALSGFSGIGNFIMNTGHNNNLQSSLSVTVIVTQ